MPLHRSSLLMQSIRSINDVYRNASSSFGYLTFASGLCSHGLFRPFLFLTIFFLARLFGISPPPRRSVTVEVGWTPLDAARLWSFMPLHYPFDPWHNGYTGVPTGIRHVGNSSPTIPTMKSDRAFSTFDLNYGAEYMHTHHASCISFCLLRDYQCLYILYSIKAKLLWLRRFGDQVIRQGNSSLVELKLSIPSITIEMYVYDRRRWLGFVSSGISE